MEIHSTFWYNTDCEYYLWKEKENWHEKVKNTSWCHNLYVVYLCIRKCVCSRGSADSIPTPSPTVVSRKGLVEEGNKLCYYSKGNKIKNKWKVIDGDHYYFDSNGYAVTGGVIFKNNVVYVFGKDHKRLENRAGKIVTIGKYSYYLTTKDGKDATG